MAHQLGPDSDRQLILVPEEGRKGWLCVTGAFFCLFSTFGFLNAIGVFQTTYEETLLSAYTSSEIAWIFSVQLSLMWAPGSLFGHLVDTYGPAPVLLPCSVLCVFSLCMTSLSTSYYQIFLAQGLGFGLGAGGIFTTSLVCVGHWFVRRRGLATGIAISGSSLGGVIFPIFFNIVKKDVGFINTIRYTALFIGILLATSCFLVTSRLPRKKWDSGSSWFDVSVFKDKTFSLYTLGAFFVMWGLWAPFDFLPQMARDRGFSSSLSLYLISIMNATSMVGRILPGYLGDRIGHMNVIVCAAFLTGVTILCLWLPFDFYRSHPGIIMFASIYGFVSGAYISLLIPCAAKAGKLEQLGQRIGSFQTVQGLSNLTGLPILGAILTRQNGNFLGLELFATCSVFIGTCLTLFAIFFSVRNGKD